MPQQLTLSLTVPFHWPDHNCYIITTPTISKQSTPTPAESNSVLQRFSIQSHSYPVGFYATSVPSSKLVKLSHHQSGDPHTTPITNLGGCLIVTTTGVYQCRQVVSPEATFLDLVMSTKLQEQGEKFGITYRLDVCGLYQEAAGKKLAHGECKQALRLYELSRVSERVNSHFRVLLHMCEYLCVSLSLYHIYLPPFTSQIHLISLLLSLSLCYPLLDRSVAPP